MKRQTKNVVLLNTVKRQENEIAYLQSVIHNLKALEQKRDDAWSKHTDSAIREINMRIRSSYQKD